MLILTTFGRPGYLRRAMGGGAVGLLVKDAPAGDLARAIRRDVAGERVIDPGPATAALSEGPNPLTDRERAVLAASARGTSVAKVTAEQHLTEGTVRNDLHAAIRKLEAQNRVEAARIAEAKGWL